MRQGRVFKRCTRCRATVPQRRCERCGSERTSWTLSIDVGPAGGKREQRVCGGFPTRRAALDGMHELQHAISQGTYVAPSKQTVGEYLEQWLPTARARLRPGAFDACASHVQVYIVPRIGDIALQALTPSRVKALYADLATGGRVRGGGGLSAKTVHNIHRTLSRALADAVSDRLIQRNPAERAHHQPASPDMPTWTAQQLRTFLAFATDDRLAALWRLAATTGIRRGELAGLRWRDVDLDRGRVTVVQQRAKGGGTVSMGPTKTRRSRRLVAIDAVTVAALRAHRKAQLEERLLLGRGYHDEDIVFCRIDGQAFHPDRLSQQFKTLVGAAGLPWITLHGLRHTHATLMLQAGVHPKVVQERLGHASIAITLDTYSHAIPAMQEDAAHRLAAIIDSTTDPDAVASEKPPPGR